LLLAEEAVLAMEPTLEAVLAEVVVVEKFLKE
jgi:hypothetical protein